MGDSSVSSARAFTKLKIRKRNPSIAYSQRHHISNPKPVQRIQVDEPEIEQEEDNPVDTPQPQPNQFASIVTEQDDDEPKNESPSDGEGTTMEGPTVEYFDMFQLEMSYYISLNTCNHDIPLSSREIPSIVKPEPQPQPLPNYLSLNVSLGEERGPEPPIKPHSPDSFRMKEVDSLTINTPPSPQVASSHPEDMYCYYRPCIDDPKKHYGFKPGLLGKSASLGVDISN
ncbi:hypothetical protein Tco_0560542 [Tanacetum coccineum]